MHDETRIDALTDDELDQATGGTLDRLAASKFYTALAGMYGVLGMSEQEGNAAGIATGLLM